MFRRSSILVLSLAALATAQLPIVPNLLSLPQRISLGVNETQLNGQSSFGRISNDGNLLLFLTDSPNVGLNPPSQFQSNLYLRRLDTGVLEFIGSNINNFPFRSVYMSADANVITFVGAIENSGTSAFGTGFSTGFIYERSTQSLRFLAHSSQGLPTPSTFIFAHGVSDDGRYVLLTTDAANLAGLNNAAVLQTYRYDRVLDVYEPVVLDMFGQPAAASNFFAVLSPDGRYVAFGHFGSNLVPNDTNNTNDVFLRDMTSTLIERISVGTGGFQSAIDSLRPNAISPDGRFVLFVSSNAALDPTRLGNGRTYFVRDRFTNTTRALPPNEVGIAPGPQPGTAIDQGCLITPSNRVIFSTTNFLPSPNGFPSPSQIWMCDLEDGAPVLVSRTASGAPADVFSNSPVISPNGRHVVFVSDATNLDPSDTNGLGFFSSGRDIYKVDISCFIDEDVIGVGKPGTAGITPLIFATDVACVNATTIAVAAGLGGAQAYLGVGFTPAAPTVVAGSPIYFDLSQPNLVAPIPNLGLPGVPGAGSFFGSIDLSGISGLSVTFQAFFIDPAAQGSFSSTRGLRINVF